jgi:hypothetical protein
MEKESFDDLLGKPEIQAFPDEFETGMTLRDYFAAKAMQGMVNSDNYANSSYNNIANYSYTMADAMLKARSK